MAIPVNKSIKLNLTHNFSEYKMLEIRFDLDQSILSVKESIEKRYGTNPDQCQLVLQDAEGNNISNMEDEKLLGFYGPKDGYWIYIIDQNPNSKLKEFEDDGTTQKYQISEEDYNKLPNTFRKFKTQMIQTGAIQQNLPPVWDENYLQEEASLIKVGDRCQLVDTKARGTVKYVGKVTNKGQGYFVGVQLDEPVGNNDGKHISVQYFQCLDKYGIFLRPNKIEVGDFPEKDIFEEDEI